MNTNKSMIYPDLHPEETVEEIIERLKRKIQERDNDKSTAL